MIGREFEQSFRKSLRTQMNDLADVLATGVKDWDEYKYITGQIAGLAFAERFFLDMVEEDDRSD
jgi:hypothetical protein